ncbi:histidine kinase [Ornithinibacter aureus]|uniref:histidine kinase n=1 Tax=Ornithinibacter aureus TaxID=622664 RepID=A0ABP8JPC5_9MICO|nr:histidine kinase [Ornithinibacter aureus]KAF0835317.1 signal transduction histidine kinase [Ornithinibacter aureus]
MATDALRSLWVEPRPANPPETGAGDWALVAAFVGWALNEAVLRDGMAPVPLLLIATLAAVAPLPWRRSHPLPAVLVAFGTLIVVDLVRMATGTQGVLPSSVSATLVLTYALFRWGSGRDAVRGLLVILTWLAITFVADVTTLTDTITGYAFFFFAAALGAAVRYRARIRVRDIEEAKAREREQLARELHDVVAHHVSGIAIQAQAGRAIAASNPGRAVEALATIEDAATQTLTELRAIVGVLRDAQHTAFTPQPGMADIEQLATTGPVQPLVEVTLTGELQDLSPSVEAAIYRLAQESVTNARRHARHATRVCVRVAGEADRVLLTVDDDGSTGSPHRSPDGYGLVGMRERATLLGGTFAAGPTADRGWRVEANLPRAGVAR